MRLPIKVASSFRIIAHRGASAYAPENSLSAFNLAVKMGIKEVETDTQLSADGQVVLCHDLSLDRYGYEGQIVEKMTWPELASLNMGAWYSPFLFKNERMITLNDLFSSFEQQLIYHVELKGKARELPEAVYRIIDEAGLHQQCIITSFSYEHLAAMRTVSDSIRLGWLVDKIDPGVLNQAAALNLFQLCPRAGQIHAEDVAKARTAVPEIRAWGLTGSSIEVIKLIQQVIKAGADGMTINWPDWVSHVG
jgi:glycerophosphoryl diester phosphodiesterase